VAAACAAARVLAASSSSAAAAATVAARADTCVRSPVEAFCWATLLFLPLVFFGCSFLPKELRVAGPIVQGARGRLRVWYSGRRGEGCGGAPLAAPRGRGLHSSNCSAHRKHFLRDTQGGVRATVMTHISDECKPLPIATPCGELAGARAAAVAAGRRESCGARTLVWALSSRGNPGPSCSLQLTTSFPCHPQSATHPTIWLSSGPDVKMAPIIC